MQVVVREPAMREGRRVCPADDHGAGLAKVGHRRAVLGSDDIAEGDHAIGGRAAALVDIDFHGHGDAVQQTQLATAGASGIGIACRGQGLIRKHVDDGVHGGIDGSDPVETGAHGFDAGNCTQSNCVSEVDC
ncbi:hypothetical protein SAMN02745126_02306 [Enhydrobacter aerosaccus]|uniref:Uncharacterized protein n=1 Tax=Enhydrobacter aerosaccus TaxID=225324 RepID=A0A1T4NIT4_9HYPH|nr:hypothetical protein SAMN02745126_02306 [Enhydrobacter aerosaccus]